MSAISSTSLKAGTLVVTSTATVVDDAYDATTWNGNNTVPTKNAIRDKIETIGSSTPSIQTLTDAATVTPAWGNAGGFLATLSQATTIANFTGSPANLDRYELRIKSTTSRALTFGSQFRFSVDLPNPVSTSGGGLTDYFGFRWNSADSKIDVVSKNFGF